MTHSSKRKGNIYERELVSQAMESGLVAERAYGSDGRALGECSEVDIKVSGERLQAKRRARLASFLQVPENTDGVVFRQDRGPTLVLVDWWHYLDLVYRANQTNNAGKSTTNVEDI